jgi:uncharacterized protein (DUF1330 family)
VRGMAAENLPPVDRRCVEPTAEQLAVVAELDPDQPVVMLNLLRYREVADYSQHPDLAPDEAISGSEAYRHYGEAAQPHIEAAGASIQYLGACGSTVIGPPGEQWDVIILVRYPNPSAFIGMVTTPEYQALSGHRAVALADSRLVPTTG